MNLRRSLYGGISNAKERASGDFLLSLWGENHLLVPLHSVGEEEALVTCSLSSHYWKKTTFSS